MQHVTHRQMRNQSAELLRRVSGGESLIVTNNGRPVAVISPVGASAIDELAERGQVRRATRPLSDVSDIQRRHASVSTAEIIDDVRGAW